MLSEINIYELANLLNKMPPKGYYGYYYSHRPNQRRRRKMERRLRG